MFAYHLENVDRPILRLLRFEMFIGLSLLKSLNDSQLYKGSVGYQQYGRKYLKSTLKIMKNLTEHFTRLWPKKNPLNYIFYDADPRILGL